LTACQFTSAALPVDLASTKLNIFVLLTCRLSHSSLLLFFPVFSLLTSYEAILAHLLGACCMPVLALLVLVFGSPTSLPWFSSPLKKCSGEEAKVFRTRFFA
jgi:hypothetical protein